MTTASQSPQIGAIPEWTLGWRLARALSHADVSTQQMAEEMGVARQTISRWMNDHGAPPRAVYVRQWSLRTGVPYEWLQNGESPRPVGPDGGDECAIRDLNPEPAGLK